MDKAGVTVSAAHKQMLALSASASASPSSSQQQLNLYNNAGGASSVPANILPPDENDSIAAVCQLISSKGFEPLHDVLSMDKW
jgi:hypothetical protein